MKLFKNKVGRPSKDILKKRRIFISSVVIFLLLIVVSGLFLFKSKNSNLKGEVVTGLTLECPTSVNAGVVFQCKTNSTKAKVRVSKKGLNEHYLKLLEKSNGRFSTPKKVINLKYDRGGFGKIVIEQDGFAPVTKHVQINKETVIKNIELHENSVSFKVVPGWNYGEKDVIDSASLYKCINNVCKIDGKLTKAKYVGRIIKGYKELASDNKNKENTQFYNFKIKDDYRRAGLFFIAVKVKNSKRASNKKLVYTKAFYKAYTATKRGGLMYSPTETVVRYGGANSANGGQPHDYPFSCGTEIYSPVKGTITYEIVTKNGRVASYGAFATIRFSGFGSNNDYGYIKFAHLSKFADIKLYSNEKNKTYPSSCSSGNCSTSTILTREVQRGEYIGDVGTSGNSTGCHLHTEVWINGSRRNPNTYFAN